MTPQEEKEKLSSKLGLMNVCWEKKKKKKMNKPSEYVNGRKKEY
jgi:hypothetical protein